MKPIAGSRGEGFCKLTAGSSGLSVNDRAVTAEELKGFLCSVRRHIVTEYLNSHSDIRRIYDATPNTLRLMVIHDSRDGPQLVGAFMRFGCAATGNVDNASAGGIVCGVDMATGQLFMPKVFVAGKIADLLVHPDSGCHIDGLVLPNWRAIKNGIVSISADYPQLVYMGYDVVVTENGFKILEINSLQDIRTMQMWYPLMNHAHARRFFEARYKPALSRDAVWRCG